MAAHLPRSYAEWRRCITVDCGIELTDRYVDARLRALRDRADTHTARFAELYGEDHLDRVIEWFVLADTELRSGR